MTTQVFEIAAALLVFVTLGGAAAWHLLEDEDNDTKLLWALVLGTSILSLLATNSSLIGIPIGNTVWALAAIGAVSAVWAVRRRAWKLGGSRLGSVLVWSLAGAVIVGWAGSIVGGAGYLGLGNPAAAEMNLLADFLRSQSMRDTVVPNVSRPAFHSIAFVIASGSAIGGEAVLAWFSALWGVKATATSFSTLTAIFALTPLSNFILLRYGLLLPFEVSRLGAVFGACNALAAFAYFQQDISSLLAIAIVPVAITAFLRLLRQPTRPAIGLSAVLLAAGAGVLPPLLWWLPLSMLVAATLEKNDLGRRGVVIALFGACVINPYHAIHAVTILFRRIPPPNEALAFVSTPWAWPVTLGLTPAVHRAQEYLNVPSWVWISAGIVLASLAVQPIYRAWESEAVRPAVVAIMGLGLCAVVLLVRQSTREQGFAVLVSGLFVGYALILTQFWSRDGLSNPGAGARLGFGLLLLANLGVTTWYGRYILGETIAAQSEPVLLPGDAAFGQLESVLKDQPAGRKVLLDVRPGAVQAWAIYAARSRETVVVTPSARLLAWTKYFHLSPAPALSGGLIIGERGPTVEADIISSGNRKDLLWSSKALELRNLQNIGAIGNGWHGREGTNESPFRWLAKDGEFTISCAANPRIQIGFDIAPGPGLANPERMIELYSGATRVLQQKITGPIRLVSPSIPSEPGSMPFRIHVVNEAGPIASDARVLNVRVSGIEVQSSATERPVDEGSYGDGWIAPQSSFRLKRIPGMTAVTISGVVPDFAKYKFPQSIKVTVNGKAAGQAKITGPGGFSLEVPLGPAGGLEDVIELRCSFFFQPSGLSKSGDTRKLSVSKLKLAPR